MAHSEGEKPTGGEDVNKAPPAIEPDQKVTLEGPALSANRFFIQLMPNGVRVAFSERAAEGLDFQFRTAVLISYQDAIELKNLLLKLLAPIEEQIDQRKKEMQNRRETDG